MAAKQKGQKDKQSGRQKQQKANPGQKEAGQEKEKQSALSSMGETETALGWLRKKGPPFHQKRSGLQSSTNLQSSQASSGWSWAEFSSDRGLVDPQSPQLTQAHQ
jgi:hypothetical protein